MYVVTQTQMREIDRRSIENGISNIELMENAGDAAVRVFCAQFPQATSKQVGILAGKGNNAGDGFVVARLLKERGISVRVFLTTSEMQITREAKQNLERLKHFKEIIASLSYDPLFPDDFKDLEEIDIFIDALLGIGLSKPIEGMLAKLIHYVNNSQKPVFSLDIASGLHADTGDVMGACILATSTVAFGFPKLGQILTSGARYTGPLIIADIGLPKEVAETVAPKIHLLTDLYIKENISPRRADSHKGKSGHLVVLAGSTGKAGASVLVAKAALRIGSGLVTAAVPEGIWSGVQTNLIEAMTLPLPDTQTGEIGTPSLKTLLPFLEDKKCLAMGPGLGTGRSVIAVVRKLLETVNIPVVLDADALTIVADLLPVLCQRTAETVLTPHPGEMARLLDTTVPQIEAHRVESARHLASITGSIVVLKGVRSIIASPKGEIYINPTGNPGMASGGMGDALTGMLAGLITQGISPLRAAASAVYLHGAIADRLLQESGRGFLANDIIDQIPYELGKHVADLTLPPVLHV